MGYRKELNKTVPSFPKKEQSYLFQEDAVIEERSSFFFIKDNQEKKFFSRSAL